MASVAAKAAFRLAIAALVLTVLFYVGRPIYWKVSATIHDIRENKRTVSEGISQLVMEAQRFGGWFHDEVDSGAAYDQTSTTKKKDVNARRF